MEKKLIGAPKETNDYLHNPGMGILYIQRGNNKIRYDQIPKDAWFLKEKLTNKVTMDIPWSILEPQEGVFHWDHSEWEGCFNSWIENGYKVGIQVRGMSTLGTLYNDGVPQWVFDAGAKYIDEPIKQHNLGGRWSIDERPIRFPVYWDPIYLEKANNFINALGKRYNGNPNIEFVIMGFMGRWGEMHISEHTPVEPWLDAGLNIPTYIKAHKKIIDMYVDAFPDTPIVQELGSPSYNSYKGDVQIPTFMHIRDAEEIIQYLVSKKVWFKYNGLGKSFEGTKDPYIDNWVIEYFDAYYSKIKVMMENLVPIKALESALKCHISYWNRGMEFEGLVEMTVGTKEMKKMFSSWNEVPDFTPWNDSPEVSSMTIEDEKNLWRYMARYVGYRFVLKELRYPQRINVGEKFTIKYKWENKGCAPCYENYGIVLALVDIDGNTVYENVQLPGVNTSSLLWDANCIVEDVLWSIPTEIKKGTYDLYIGMKDMKNPKIGIELAIGGKDSQKRYKVGAIEVIK